MGRPFSTIIADIYQSLQKAIQIDPTGVLEQIKIDDLQFNST
ncbi:MAG: hypothetical protein WD431_14855 [Cyclobacteriaceae bacterium]